MTEIAGVMLDAVEENFEQEGRPEKWTPLADATVEDRRKKGFGPEHPILQRTGTLAASVQAHSSRSEAMVTTNLRYAAIHKFRREGRAQQEGDNPAASLHGAHKRGRRRDSEDS